MKVSWLFYYMKTLQGHSWLLSFLFLAKTALLLRTLAMTLLGIGMEFGNTDKSADALWISAAIGMVKEYRSLTPIDVPMEACLIFTFFF